MKSFGLTHEDAQVWKKTEKKNLGDN